MCTVVQYRTGFNITVVKVGRGFYEFTKPEIISHRKEVVLVDKVMMIIKMMMMMFLLSRNRGRYSQEETRQG